MYSKKKILYFLFFQNLALKGTLFYLPPEFLEI